MQRDRKQIIIGQGIFPQSVVEKTKHFAIICNKSWGFGIVLIHSSNPLYLVNLVLSHILFTATKINMLVDISRLNLRHLICQFM